MYKSLRIIRISVSLIALTAVSVALVAGYDSIFARMQIGVALMSGTAVWLAVWAALTLVYGRIYCSTVCPLGTFQDIVAFGARLIGRRGRSNYRYRRPSPVCRIVFVGVALVCVLVGASLLPTLFDPYSAYARMVRALAGEAFGNNAEGAGFALASYATAAITAIGVGAAAFRRGRLVCNTVCPIGTLLGYGARYSLLHADIDTDRCINCGECERVCKGECINLIDHTVDLSRCVVCFDCMAVCPNSAITYRSGSHRLSTPLMRPVVPGAQKAEIGTTVPADGPKPASPATIQDNETISRPSAPHS